MYCFDLLNRLFGAGIDLRIMEEAAKEGIPRICELKL